MILSIALNIKADNFVNRNIKPLLSNPNIDDTYIKYMNSNPREEYYRLSKKGFLAVMSSVKLKHFIISEIINQYFLDLDALSNMYTYYEDTTMRDYRSVGTGQLNKLRMLMGRLTRISPDKLHIPFNVISLWSYEILRFPKNYKRNINSKSVKLENPAPEMLIKEEERMKVEKVRIFLLGVIEDALASGIDNCIENDTMVVGFDISIHVPKALRLISTRNPDNEIIQSILSDVNWKPLHLMAWKDTHMKHRMGGHVDY